jgi:ATP-dependent protease Clp ATPase subunit
LTLPGIPEGVQLPSHQGEDRMKISIPRETVEQIAEQYRCTPEEAAKAYLDAQDSANDAFKESLESHFGKRPSAESVKPPKIFTPKEIKTHLDKYVIGQEEYKKRLSIAAA